MHTLNLALSVLILFFGISQVSAQISQSVSVRNSSKLAATYTIKGKTFEQVRMGLQAEVLIEKVMKRLMLSNFQLRDTNPSTLGKGKKYLYSFKLNSAKRNNDFNNDYFFSYDYNSACDANDSACLGPFSLNFENSFTSLKSSDLYEVGVAKTSAYNRSSSIVQLLNTFKIKIDGSYNSSEQYSVIDLLVEIDPAILRMHLSSIQGNRNVTDIEILKIMDEIYRSLLKYLESNI